MPGQDQAFLDSAMGGEGMGPGGPPQGGDPAKELVMALVSLGDPNAIMQIAQTAIDMLKQQGGGGQPQPPSGTPPGV